jgi:hypothetical protein
MSGVHPTAILVVRVVLAAQEYQWIQICVGWHPYVAR